MGDCCLVRLITSADRISNSRGTETGVGGVSGSEREQLGVGTGVSGTTLLLLGCCRRSCGGGLYLAGELRARAPAGSTSLWASVVLKSDVSMALSAFWLAMSNDAVQTH